VEDRIVAVVVVGTFPESACLQKKKYLSKIKQFFVKNK